MDDRTLVTLLFTDIEGSTRRWEQQRAAMAAALARHDAILRSAIEEAGGRVFKTVGDAFCAAFSSAQVAVRAALAAQRGLLAEDWSACGPDFASLRVRMGIHTGAPDVRDGDYFGPDVNRVARLMSAGHGGQVLVSGATAALVAECLPEDLCLRDLGERRLKDLRQPEHIFQLTAPELATDFPPLATLDARPNNLPLQLTALVGREAELQELARMLRADAGPRLITLTGPGGTGKTRLALQTAAEAVDDFHHGVWWVDLSALTDPGLVVSAIATVLGVDEVPGIPIEDTLTAWLSKRALLLVLDNHEQLLPAAPLAARLLAAAPGLKVLVTSRESLHLRGERTFPVETLAVPAASSGQSMAALVQFAAVRLFMDRALEAKPSFVIDNHSAAVVAEICLRLDGLPLAIELAAARINLLSPSQLLERLRSRLKLLTGGAQDLPERQRTMRAAIAWSYELLDAPEQRLFRRLSVFVGGWTLDAAESVAGDDSGASAPRENPDIDILDGLASLAAKSLIRPPAGSSGAGRFAMLETLREFGFEQLEASGERPTQQARHARYFGTLARSNYVNEPHLAADSASETPGAKSHLDQQDNVRAALDWALDHDRSMGLELLLRSGLPLSEMADRLQRLAVDLDAAPAGARAAAAEIAASLAFALGRFQQAETRYREAADLHAQAGDEPAQADCLLALGWSLFHQGRMQEFEDLIDRVAALAERLQRRGTMLGLWDARTQLASALGQHERARECVLQANATWKRFGLAQGGEPHNNYLIWQNYAAGDLDAAESLMAQHLQVFGDTVLSRDTYFLHTIGMLHLACGRYAQAGGAFLAGLRLCREEQWLSRENPGLLIDCLVSVARLQAAPLQAATLRGAADACRSAGGYAYPPALQEDHESEAAALRAALGAPTFDAAWTRGQAMTLDEALELAAATVSTARYDDPADFSSPAPVAGT